MAPSRGPEPLARALHTTLENHKGPVHVARYAKGTAKYVLTGGQDRTSYSAHGYEVLSISVAHDNTKFASSGGDRSVFLWDVTTGNTLRRISAHLTKINVVEFNADATVVASGSYDSTVKLWDLRAQNRQPIQALEEARDSVQTLYVGSSRIMSGSVDGHVRTYDLRKGELRADYIGHPVTSVVPTQDESTWAHSPHGRFYRKLLNDFSGHAHTSYRWEASIVAGDENGAVWAWDLLDAKPLQPNPPPKIHHKVITWTEHHPAEAGELITASADGTVKVWRYPASGS
ncbi:nuclear mRNA splicing protein [Lactarius quietus]|nr:nuclear mRNA splicing protein [Lactarius quietus]